MGTEIAAVHSVVCIWGVMRSVHISASRNNGHHQGQTGPARSEFFRIKGIGCIYLYICIRQINWYKRGGLTRVQYHLRLLYQVVPGMISTILRDDHALKIQGL